MTNSSTRTIVALAAVAVLALVAWAVLTMPDRRSTGQRIGDAVDALPQGVDKAAQQLESRTPGERLGDAVENAGERIKETTNTNNQ